MNPGKAIAEIKKTMIERRSEGIKEWKSQMVELHTQSGTRPLSPNIQIYRPQLTSVLSIANRITGVVLSLCAVALVVWLIAAAAGPQAYAVVHMSSSDHGPARSCCSAAPFPFSCISAAASGISSGIRSTASSFGRYTLRDGRSWRRAWCSQWWHGSSACLWQGGADEQRDLALAARPRLGLGSAKSGVQQWWLERVTAIALVPLTLWFAASIIAHTGSDYAVFIAWLRTPVATILMVLLLTALFYHTALGLQVVIEDYVHSGSKVPALLGVRFGCIALAVAGILATLHIAFGG